jgi:hypothetical protein
LCASAALLHCGCGSPNKANIQLRKQNQALKSELETLKRIREADAATIAALQARTTGGGVAQLAPEKLDRLFTVAGLQLGKLTGGYDADRSTPGDDAVRVQAVPTDTGGQSIKAAGAFVVEAFDLSGEGRLVARWEFDSPAAKKQWHGGGLLYDYLFTLPLPERPAPPQLTLKVTFTDELTGRKFTQQRPITLDLSGGTQ